MNKTLLMMVGAIVASGCAYVPPTANIPEMADAYHAVASGQVPGALADRIQFNRVASGVSLRRTWTESFDGWISKMDDASTADNVDQVLRRDTALRGQNIHSSVDSGVADLRGQVSSDYLAMRAARDVVGVAGVIIVNVQLTSQQSPTLPSQSQ